MSFQIRAGVLTLSDRSARFERPDLSGPALVKVLLAEDWQVERQEVIPDDFDSIQKILVNWSDVVGLDLILTTGGTGFGIRDVTPEATMAIVDRQAPGITEAMRAASLQVTPHGMLSRAVAGIRGRTLIINLPGSPKAALENLSVVLSVLPHAVELLHGDPKAEQGHNRPTSSFSAQNTNSGDTHGLSA